MDNEVKLNILDGKFISYGDDFFANKITFDNGRMVMTDNDWFCYINRKEELICETNTIRLEDGSKPKNYTFRYIVSPDGQATFVEQTSSGNKVHHKGHVIPQSFRHRPISGTLILPDSSSTSGENQPILKTRYINSFSGKLRVTYQLTAIKFKDPNRIYRDIVFSSNKGICNRHIYTDGKLFHYARYFDKENKSDLKYFSSIDEDIREESFIVYDATWVVIDTKLSYSVKGNNEVPFYDYSRVMYISKNIKSAKSLEKSLNPYLRWGLL